MHSCRRTLPLCVGVGVGVGAKPVWVPVPVPRSCWRQAARYWPAIGQLIPHVEMGSALRMVKIHVRCSSNKIVLLSVAGCDETLQFYNCMYALVMSQGWMLTVWAATRRVIFGSHEPHPPARQTPQTPP